MKIVEIRPEIELLVKQNDGHCPCAIWHTDDTKCICKEFRERKEPGECACGRFEKVEDNEQT